MGLISRVSSRTYRMPRAQSKRKRVNYNDDGDNSDHQDYKPSPENSPEKAYKSLVTKSRALVMSDGGNKKKKSTKKTAKFVGKVPVNLSEDDVKGSFSAYGGM